MPSGLGHFSDIFARLADGMMVVGWAVDIDGQYSKAYGTASSDLLRTQAVCGFAADSTMLFKRVDFWNDIEGDGGLQQQLKGCLPVPVMFHARINDSDETLTVRFIESVVTRSRGQQT